MMSRENAMVTMKVVGSSSAGNSYILRAGKDVLLIEAGVKFSEIKKALDWNLSDVVGCVVTHCHGDHSRSLADVMKAGIPVFGPESALKVAGGAIPFGKALKPLKGAQIGPFKVFPFPVLHDVPCFGYIIEHELMGRLMFVTDTMMLEYTFPGLNHIMLEANYADDILLDNIERGIEPREMKNRLVHSHMELGTALGILRENDLSQVRDITLIHLSSRNSDARRFRQVVEMATGIPAEVAVPGMEINMSKGGF